MVFRWISYLPLPVLYVVSDLLYAVVYYLAHYRYQVVKTNLVNSFPEKDTFEIQSIIKHFYRNFCDYVVETLKSVSISGEEIKKRVVIRDSHLMEQYLNNGTSVLALTSHQFNWEWLLLALSQHISAPLNPVYKKLNSQYFDSLLLGIRSRFDCQPVEMQQTLSRIFSQRDEAHAYGFLADQTPLADADIYWSIFLNQETAFFTGTERIAHLTDYPVLFIGMKKLKRGYYEINFEKIAEPPYMKGDHTILDRYVEKIEQQIREKPAGWLWSHRRWKHKRPVEI
jgi:KDO2-lipid IV(A) lauroyltransferase